jgi:NAD(P)-dependent dehydrogenase (short-subunit alcohol dehydrogenase family)
MSPALASSLDTSEEIFDKVVALNFKGPYRLSALIGARMAHGNGGSIINVSSVGSLIPRASYGPYAGAKAALNAITTAHAHEFGPKVRVNAILPGAFRTDIAKAWPKEREAELHAAMARYGEPAEIVTTALYLASRAQWLHDRGTYPGRWRSRVVTRAPRSQWMADLRRCDARRFGESSG